MRFMRAAFLVGILVTPLVAIGASASSESSPFAQLNPFFEPQSLPSQFSQTAALRVDIYVTMDRPPYCGPVKQDDKTRYFYRCSTDLYPEEIPQLKALAAQGEAGTKNKCLFKNVIIDLSKNVVDVYLLSIKTREEGCDPAVACKSETDPSAARTRLRDANSEKTALISNCQPGADIKNINTEILKAVTTSSSKPGGLTTPDTSVKNIAKTTTNSSPLSSSPYQLSFGDQSTFDPNGSFGGVEVGQFA